MHAYTYINPEILACIHMRAKSTPSPPSLPAHLLRGLRLLLLVQHDGQLHQQLTELPALAQ